MSADKESKLHLLAEERQVLLSEMQKLTFAHCGKDGKCSHAKDRPYKCCSADRCREVLAGARIKYGIELRTTGHNLPLMGEDGCSVPPHLREQCVMHSCLVSCGARPANDQERDLLDQYGDLKRKIGENGRAMRELNSD